MIRFFAAASRWRICLVAAASSCWSLTGRDFFLEIRLLLKLASGDEVPGASGAQRLIL